MIPTVSKAVSYDEIPEIGQMRCFTIAKKDSESVVESINNLMFEKKIGAFVQRPVILPLFFDAKEWNAKAIYVPEILDVGMWCHLNEPPVELPSHVQELLWEAAQLEEASKDLAYGQAGSHMRVFRSEQSCQWSTLTHFL